jgi:hypothetical protein
MTITVILATIGGTTLILTAAARVPSALAEFLRACIPAVTALRELRTALNGCTPRGDSAKAEHPPSASPPPP